MRGARRFHTNGQARCRAGCISREATAPELSHRKRRGFVERAGGHFHRVTNAVSVGEGDEAVAGGRHEENCIVWAKKRRITLCCLNLAGNALLRMFYPNPS